MSLQSRCAAAPQPALRPSCHPSIVLALGLWLAAAPALGQSKPAVDVVNGSLGGGYAYQEIAESAASASGSTTTVPAETRQGWLAQGTFTFPIVDRLGGRVFVDGGISKLELEPAPGFGGRKTDGVFGGVGLDLFVRDPDVGAFQVGYRFALRDPIDPRADRDLTQGVAADFVFYIPDEGLGTVDWGGGFTWGFGRVEGPSYGDDVARLEARFDAGWYWLETLRFTPGFRLFLEDPDLAEGYRDLRGRAELEWLPPIGQLRFVSLRAFGSGGRRRSQLAAPYSDVDRTLWSIGGGATVYFPGVKTLVQLKRERQ